MADRKLYDEIESSLMAAHEKGIDWSTIDLDREASVVAAEAVMAFMVPALAAGGHREVDPSLGAGTRRS
jgi:hypothetical protein